MIIASLTLAFLDYNCICFLSFCVIVEKFDVVVEGEQKKGGWCSRFDSIAQLTHIFPCKHTLELECDQNNTPATCPATVPLRVPYYLL